MDGGIGGFIINNFSTVVDYSVGQKLGTEHKKFKRKSLLWTSIIVNIGLLGFFKYYNFFLYNFVEAFSLFGTQIKANSLNIILPVGISFYTFQTLSYTIDVYKKKLDPSQDFISFSAFVCFFPQLVAGPIERAANLLPQFCERRTFEYNKSVDGMRQIIWGFFKKVVIADNCAVFANYAFNNSAELNGSTLLLGAIFFTFQIYGDFSGYSDIAIGTSRLFGFNLKQNFATPYFSRDIAEFWRRWHISLSTWFRDYLYIPLGGSRGGMWQKVRNTFIIFIVSGFWHGPNWNFILWGALNAIYFLPLLLTKRNRKNIGDIAEGKLLPTLRDFTAILTTFILTVFAWIFFRAENLNHAFKYIRAMFSETLFNSTDFQNSQFLVINVFIILIFLIFEWIGRSDKFAIEKLFLNINIKYRILIYYIILLMIIYFCINGEQQEFIYFQF